MGKIIWASILAFCLALGHFDVLLWWRIFIYMTVHVKLSTQNGFLEAQKTFVLGDLDVDLTGRSYMITGANSGIGKSTARVIAQRHGTIHMVCRSRHRAEIAREEIVAESGNENIFVHVLDMSKLAEVHKFALEFSMQHESLNVLINNAAVMLHNRTLTSEDLEVNFAVNTMGYFVLTTDLLPVLKRAKEPRVVMVSSGGILNHDLMVEDLQHDKRPFVGNQAYSQQKRHQTVIAKELANVHTNIFFASMDPGWVDTPSLRNSLPDFHEAFKGQFRTPDQGADTVVWLAVSRAALTHESGLYFMDRKPVQTYLPFTFIQESEENKKQLMKKLNEISRQLRPNNLPQDLLEEI